MKITNAISAAPSCSKYEEPTNRIGTPLAEPNQSAGWEPGLLYSVFAVGSQAYSTCEAP